MSSVLDASALLAALYNEPGSDAVAEALESDPVMSAINLSEVAAKLIDHQHDPAFVRTLLDDLQLDIVPFEEDDAYTAVGLREATRRAGLSFGDRACLALAIALDLPVLTADRTWGNLDLPIEVVVIR